MIEQNGSKIIINQLEVIDIIVKKYPLIMYGKIFSFLLVSIIMGQTVRLLH